MDGAVLDHDDKHRLIKISYKAFSMTVDDYASVIDFSNTCLTDECFAKISQVFNVGSIRTNLIELNLSHNELTKEGMQTLSRVIQQGFPSLQVIKLNGNNIGDSGVSVLFTALSTYITSYCPSLTFIDFSRTSLSDQGAYVLARWISCCNGSIVCSFAHNPISGAGIGALLRSRYWEAFCIEGNSLDDLAQEVFEQVPQACLLLKSLTIKDNHLSNPVSFFRGFFKELIIPSLQTLVISESLGSTEVAMLKQIGYEKGLASLKKLVLIDCHLSLFLIVDFYMEFCAGCFPRLIDLQIRETKSFVFHVSFHSSFLKRHGNSILIHVYDNYDYSLFVAALFRDPEMHSIEFVGNEKTSLNPLVGNELLCNSTCLFESICMSHIKISLYMLQQLLISLPSTIKNLQLNHMIITDLQKTFDGTMILQTADELALLRNCAIFPSPGNSSYVSYYVMSSLMPFCGSFAINSCYQRHEAPFLQLHYFSIEYSNLGNDICLILFYLLGFTDIAVLDLEGNQFDDVGVRMLFDYVMENSIHSITRILVDYDALSAESVSMINQITNIKEGFQSGSFPTIRNPGEKSKKFCCCTFF